MSDDILRIILLKDELAEQARLLEFLEDLLDEAHTVLCNEGYFSFVEAQRERLFINVTR